MKNITVGLLIGLLLGFAAGYFISDASAYAKVKELRREAFTGGLISMCVSIQDENNTQIFTVDQCDVMAQQSIANDYFEQWDSVKAP